MTNLSPQPSSEQLVLDHVEIKLDGFDFNPMDLRSEDLRFSPSGRRLAVVTTQSKILIFETDLNTRPVRAELITTLVSDDLSAPHGIDWVDEDSFVVANRRAGFAFFTIPRANRWDAETRIRAVSTLQSSWFGKPGETRPMGDRKVITGPGSARIHNGYLYAGCNRDNTITRHRLLDGPICEDGELIAQTGIDIPDSALPSPDGRWLAVGDHNNHRVLFFRMGEDQACGELRDPNLKFPHGIGFDREGRTLFCADAGGPRLFAFHAEDGRWDAERHAADASIEGVDRSVFDQVQTETPAFVRALEGGTKGVDVARESNLVVTTCRGQTLRGFTWSLPQ